MENNININIEAELNKMSFELVQAIKGKKNKISKYKNAIDKSLGVLMNDGVYAYYIYVKSEEIDNVFLDEIKDLKKFVEINGGNKDNPKLDEEYFQSLSEDLEKLLFFRELLEKVLIYARYHAKAELKGFD
ncbi:MAG TPA: hypothetical protein PK723_04665 [Candidatus Pacearchaeota archaeon]|nr:hypothetical protein [Candidatus Pacearchaeota archaeon]